MAKKKESVHKIVEVAKDGTEDELLAMFVNGSEADLSPRALAAAYFCAAGRGFIRAVSELLKRGVDVCVTNGRFSGLGMASKYARSEMVKLLLANHAEVDVRNERQETPLILACKELQACPYALSDYCNVVADLFAAGADPNAEDRCQMTGLIYACEGYDPTIHEDLTIPRLFIAHGVNLSHFSCAQDTPLSMAVLKGHVPLAKLLLDHGHPVDIGGKSLYPPLVLAAVRGRAEMVQLLLEHKANPNVTTVDDTTALMAACENNHLEVVKVLIAWGVDWKTPTAKGLVHEIAERHKWTNITQYLDSLL